MPGKLRSPQTPPARRGILHMWFPTTDGTTGAAPLCAGLRVPPYRDRYGAPFRRLYAAPVGRLNRGAYW